MYICIGPVILSFNNKLSMLVLKYSLVNKQCVKIILYEAVFKKECSRKKHKNKRKSGVTM
jgi:hypothetical protein